MWTVVTGGSGSGKSEFAESVALSREPGEKIYIATMEPYDKESYDRIDRHRAMRREKNFQTVECYRHLEELEGLEDRTVLLECMSNLTANEMFHPEGRGEDSALAIWQGLRRLADTCRHLIVVTNNVFDDGIQYAPESMRYLEILGEVNSLMGQAADEVYEVVCGIPIPWKKQER